MVFTNTTKSPLHFTDSRHHLGVECTVHPSLPYSPFGFQSRDASAVALSEDSKWTCFTLSPPASKCLPIQSSWDHTIDYFVNVLPDWLIVIFTARCTLVQARYCDRMSSVSLSVRPSVRPSVTLVNCDHIGWNSSKIISRSVSLVCSLFATQTSRVYSKGNTLEFSPE